MWELNDYKFSAIASTNDGNVYAATFGQGIIQKTTAGFWQPCSEGLPDQSTTYRLQIMGDSIYAATDRGLFVLDGNQWLSAGIDVPCFHIMDTCNTFAMTQKGLMYREEGSWKPFAYSDHSCYDVLRSPQFLFVALSSGIANYVYFYWRLG